MCTSTPGSSACVEPLSHILAVAYCLRFDNKTNICFPSHFHRNTCISLQLINLILWFIYFLLNWKLCLLLSVSLIFPNYQHHYSCLGVNKTRWPEHEHRQSAVQDIYKMTSAQVVCTQHGYVRWTDSMVFGIGCRVKISSCNGAMTCNLKM